MSKLNELHVDPYKVAADLAGRSPRKTIDTPAKEAMIAQLVRDGFVRTPSKGGFWSRGSTWFNYDKGAQRWQFERHGQQEGMWLVSEINLRESSMNVDKAIDQLTEADDERWPDPRWGKKTPDIDHRLNSLPPIQPKSGKIWNIVLTLRHGKDEVKTRAVRLDPATTRDQAFDEFKAAVEVLTDTNY